MVILRHDESPTFISNHSLLPPFTSTQALLRLSKALNSIHISSVHTTVKSSQSAFQSTLLLAISKIIYDAYSFCFFFRTYSPTCLSIKIMSTYPLPFLNLSLSSPKRSILLNFPLYSTTITAFVQSLSHDPFSICHIHFPFNNSFPSILHHPTHHSKYNFFIFQVHYCFSFLLCNFFSPWYLFCNLPISNPAILTPMFLLLSAQISSFK